MGKMALLAAVGLTVASAAGAQSLIVRSVGPSSRTYPAGTLLPSAATLRLLFRDEIEVMTRQGTRLFRGPGDWALTAPSQTVTLSDLIRRVVGPPQPAPGASGTVVVVRAAGPSAARYAPGAVLPAGTVLALRAGDEIVVADGSGSRTLKGPGNVSARDARAAAAVALAWGAKPASKVSSGAMRGVSPPAAAVLPPAPTLFALSVERGGTLCYFADGQPQLYRSDRSAAAQVTIEREGATPVPVSFAAGEIDATLPALADGALTIVTADGARSTAQLKRLTQPPDGFEALAVALRDNGCGQQLEQLSRAAAAIEAATAPETPASDAPGD
jgi:hypothetical protein